MVSEAPLLRVYRWSPPAVSIGYHQSADKFDRSALADRGFDLVKRPTGGRAILHAEELTYAVIGASPSPLFGDTLHDVYMSINRALLLFLEGLGIRADISAGESQDAQRGLVCFQSAGQHEIRVGGRKLIGSAQRRIEQRFLQHGSILTGPRHAELMDFLAGHHSQAEARAQLLAATTDLGRLQGRRLQAGDYADLSNQLVRAFAAAFRLEPVPEQARPAN
jgi:lipoate-protein ligase A